MENLENEEWRKVPGFDYYEVSNMGRVRSLPRPLSANTRKRYKRRFFEPRLLNPHKNPKGYNVLMLVEDGKRVHYRLHRLIAKVFIPNPQNKPHIDHINAVKSDNRVENLRWVTPLENMQNPLVGPAISRAITGRKLTWTQKGRPVYKICQTSGVILDRFDRIADAARSVGKKPNNLHLSLKDNKRVIYGFIWKYATES